MKKVLEIIGGLIFLIVPVVLWIKNTAGFGDAALEILKGGVMWILILIGLVLIIVGITDLKS